MTDETHEQDGLSPEELEQLLQAPTLQPTNYLGVRNLAIVLVYLDIPLPVFCKRRRLRNRSRIYRLLRLPDNGNGWRSRRPLLSQQFWGGVGCRGYCNRGLTKS